MAQADPLSEVKVGEFGSWLSRRNFSLPAIRSALGRAMWTYRLKYIAPKKANAAFIFHFIFVTFTINYFIYEYPVRSKWFDLNFDFILKTYILYFNFKNTTHGLFTIKTREINI